uniref:Uncharacterized protein n=1 Tax=Rhizobium rhizogenes TaxID=359 RepID=A0A7S4ZS06_RHIRH|nr:hypothetical protein pC5.8b_458 [Rhizobium rhizogenes]
MREKMVLCKRVLCMKWKAAERVFWSKTGNEPSRARDAPQWPSTAEMPQNGLF